MTVTASVALSNDMCLPERALKGPAIDVHVWSSLPDDVLHRILLWLPLASKRRFKRVCKSWNLALSSDKLLSYTTNSSDGTHSFVLCTSGEFACALDPSTNTWRKLSKPACPATSILAAGGGLVCLGNQVSECRVLSACNPLTKVSRVLPRMPRVGLIHKVAIAVDDDTKAYLIVVTGEECCSFRGRHVYRLLTDVYDSISGSWRVAGDALPDAKFGSDPGVWCNGLFYCITELPYGLTAFDLSKGCWIEYQVQMPEGMSSPSLVSCRGQLLMVGTQRNPLQRSSRSAKVWSLYHGKAWQLFDQMPEDVCSEFMSHLSVHTPLVCAGVGDLVFITSHLSPAAVTFDIKSRSWKQIPSDPLFPKCRDPHLLGFSLQLRI